MLPVNILSVYVVPGNNEPAIYLLYLPSQEANTGLAANKQIHFLYLSDSPPAHFYFYECTVTMRIFSVPSDSESASAVYRIKEVYYTNVLHISCNCKVVN